MSDRGRLELEASERNARRIADLEAMIDLDDRGEL